MRLPPELWARVLRTTRVVERCFRLEPGELTSYAWEAAERAARDPRADPKHLERWVLYIVRRRLIDAVRQLSPVSRRMRQQGHRRAISLHEIQEGHDHGEGAHDVADYVEALRDRRSALDCLLEREALTKIASAIQKLPDRERHILTEHLAGKTLTSLARELGLSEPRLSQLRSRAVERLAVALSETESRAA